MFAVRIIHVFLSVFRSAVNYSLSRMALWWQNFSEIWKVLWRLVSQVAVFVDSIDFFSFIIVSFFRISVSTYNSKQLQVNRQLDKMGYNIGLRLADDLLAKNSQIQRCTDMHQVADVLAKVALRSYLGENDSLESPHSLDITEAS